MFTKCARPIGRIAQTGKTNRAQHVQKIYLSSQEVMDRESKYCAHNYHPLPVALKRGEGIS